MQKLVKILLCVSVLYHCPESFHTHFNTQFYTPRPNIFRVIDAAALNKPLSNATCNYYILPTHRRIQTFHEGRVDDFCSKTCRRQLLNLTPHTHTIFPNKINILYQITQHIIYVNWYISIILNSVKIYKNVCAKLKAACVFEQNILFWINFYFNKNIKIIY